ncbi:hypothetical protein AMTRI_Chr02g263950 [Amborella trichopoda]
MTIQRDQIIHLIKKIPNEHEHTQSPLARVFHKENAKDCLSTRTMIQERMKEQTSPREVPIEVEGTNLQKAQDTPILDNRRVIVAIILKLKKMRKVQEKSRFRLKKQAHKKFRTSL